MGRVYSVDGPAGAGKDTAAEIAAREINFIRVDSGALYRLITLHFLHKFKNVVPTEEDIIHEILEDISIQIRQIDSKLKWILNKKEIPGNLIRTPEVTLATSILSQITSVRKKVDDILITLPKDNNIIVCGRDIGSKVFPEADHKFFITASAETRAKRRLKQEEEKGNKVNYDEILKNIIQRDWNDTHRAEAPLVQPADATFIDTTYMTVEETAKIIISTHLTSVT